MSGHKTDVEAVGDYFTLAKSGRRFDMDRFMGSYIKVMGVSGTDALFPIELGIVGVLVQLREELLWGQGEMSSRELDCGGLRRWIFTVERLILELYCLWL